MSNVDLAKLVVSMEARQAQYLKELKKSRAQTKSWRDKTKRDADAVKKAFQQLAIAGAVTAAATAMKVMIDRASNAAQTLTNLSNIAGLTTDEFQRQAYALQSVGFDADKFADTVKDVNDKLGDFLATGGGAAADFFENLAPKVGITAESLKNLSGTEVLIAVKKAMDEANVSAKEQVFYMEALASDATALLPLLADEGRELNRLAREYDNLGVSMSGAEIVELNNIAAENRKLTASFDALVAKLTASVGPAILMIFQNITTGISNVVGATKWAGEEIAAAFNGPALGDIVRINDALRDATKEANILRDALSDGKKRRGDSYRKAQLAALDEEIAKLTKMRDLYIQNNKPPEPLENNIGTGGVAITIDGGVTETPEQKAARDQAALDAFTRLQESLFTEEEALRASHKRQTEILKEALARDQITRAQASIESQKLSKKMAQWELKKEQDLAAAKQDVAVKTLDFGIALAKDGSKTERALLAVKKAIALKDAIFNLKGAAAKALNLPYPKNMVAVGTVAGLGADIIGELKSESANVPSFLGGGIIPDGPRTGGVDGKGGIEAIVHPGETIIDPENAGGLGAAVVNVHNYTGERVDVLTEGDVINIMVGQMGNQASKARSALHASSTVQPRGRA